MKGNQNPFNRSTVISALLKFNNCLNLYASKLEYESAWDSVIADNDNQKVESCFEAVNTNYKLVEIPYKDMKEAQLPALVLSKDNIGILKSIDDENGKPNIEWQSHNINDIDNISYGTNNYVFYCAIAWRNTSSNDIGSERAPGRATDAIKVAVTSVRPFLLHAALITVFINLIMVVSGFFTMQVYDRVIPNFAYATLWYMAAGVIIAYIIDYIFKIIKHKINEGVKKRIDEGLSSFFFKSLLEAKADKKINKIGILASQVSQYEVVKQFIASSATLLIADLPFVLFFIIIIATIGGAIALVPAVFVIVCLAVGFINYKPVKKLQSESSDAAIRRQGLLYEVIANAELIKSIGNENQILNKWLLATRETIDRNESYSIANSYSIELTKSLQQLCIVIMLIVGVYVIESGQMTMGGMIACSILGGRTLGFISQITNVLTQWHGVKFALNTLDNLLDLPRDTDHGRENYTSNNNLSISCKDISYTHLGCTNKILDIPKLDFNCGDRIAVLGKNGSGKSTLLKILAGINQIDNGSIRIASMDYESCKLSWLRSVIGYLPQDVNLFSGSLKENLTAGLSNISEKMIWDALEKTGFDAAVRDHSDGLMLQVGERGMGLSGGQRQLVQLTRLVLQDPQIWILDEPNASLDSTSEQKIKTLVESLTSEKTIIFTTHKKSWLSLSNRIVVLEKGSIMINDQTKNIKAMTRQEAS